MRIYATERYYEKLKKNTTNEKNSKKIIEGIKGEKEVFHFLKTLSVSNYKGFIIPNFKFKYVDETVECDFIVVTKNSIIILEVKNWKRKVSISSLGQVDTKDDNDTRNNVIAQVIRQKELLQEKLKKDLEFDVNIEYCILFSNTHIHELESSESIIDYSTVVPRIEQIINQNRSLTFELKKIHDYFIRENENIEFDSKNFYKDTNKDTNDDFLNNINSNNDSKKNKNIEFVQYDLNNHHKYFFQLCKNSSKEDGCFVNIPEGIKVTYEKIDTRMFAVIYNLLIRGNDYFIPRNLIMNFDYGKIKFEIHYFMLCTLLFIKNGYFIFYSNSNTIDIPISCDSKVELASKKIFAHLIELFAKVSDVKQYNINYTGEYEVLFDEFKVNISVNKLVYIETCKNLLGQKYLTEMTYCKSIWYADRIKYSFDNNYEFIREIVEILFGFSKFNDGQLECINSAFKNDTNQVIMLPTGQGKSIIFYLLLLLQPQMGIIIYPTNLLVKDQIDKLQHFHIDNINNFSDTKTIDNSHIQIMIPDNILEKSVLEKFININKGIPISYLILDEVHCLSKYSHDFRPEYFLMHDKINYYLNKTIVKGFTATATWEILEDLKEQFHMASEDIFSPNLSRIDIEYVVRNITNENHINTLISDIEYIRKNYKEDKILVFTNDLAELNFVKSKLNVFDVTYIFDEEDYYDIDNFRLYGNDVLVSAGDLGIGIDIPEINTIIHFKQPLSIADFAQHVGRGGRADYSCTAIVYYDDNEYNNINSRFENIEQLITMVYTKLEQSLNRGHNWAEIEINQDNELNYKFVFFSFFQLGIISEWWREDITHFGIGIDRNFQLNLNLIKRHLFEKMKNESSFIQIIKNSSNLIDLAIQYFRWFQEWDYLFKKNSYELMKDLLKKITTENYKNDQIQKRIKTETYYSNLEIVKIESIKKMSFKEIAEFINNNTDQLQNYRKYLNSTNINIRFLSLLIDLNSNVNNKEIIIKLDSILDNLNINEKFSLLCCLVNVENIYNYNFFIEHLYLKVYKRLNKEEKIIIFNNMDNVNIENNYKYLFLFSLIRDNFMEEAR